MSSHRGSIIHYQWRFLALVLATVIGVALGIGSIPMVFRLTGSGARYARLDEALRSESSADVDVVLLGNSTVMAGMDARQLNELLPESSHAWNLSTPGQMLPESIMVLNRLGKNVKTVVWGIGLGALTIQGHDIASSKVTQLDLTGFLPWDELGDLARQAHSPALAKYRNSIPFEQSLPDACKIILRDLHSLVAGRWILKDFIDTKLRTVLRKDIDFDRTQNDLYFPTMTVKVEKDKLKHQLKRFCHAYTAEDGQMSDASTLLISLAADTARQKGIRLLIVLMPVHPYQIGISEPAFYSKLDKQLNQLVSPVTIVNLHDALDGEDFGDVCHATRSGADKITRRLAEELNKTAVSIKALPR